MHTPYIHIYHIEQKVYIKEVGKVNKCIICFKHFSYYINYPSTVYNAVYIIWTTAVCFEINNYY